MDMEKGKTGGPLTKRDINCMWDSYDSLVEIIDRAESQGMLDIKSSERTKHQLKGILERIQDSV